MFCYHRGLLAGCSCFCCGAAVCLWHVLLPLAAGARAIVVLCVCGVWPRGSATASPAFTLGDLRCFVNVLSDLNKDWPQPFDYFTVRYSSYKWVVGSDTFLGFEKKRPQ